MVNYMTPADRTAVVILGPEHTSGTAHRELTAQVLLDLAGHNDRLIIDLTRTDTLDGRFLALLASVRARMGDRGGGFALCGLSPFCNDLLRVCHLDAVCPAYSSVREALAALAGEPSR